MFHNIEDVQWRKRTVGKKWDITVPTFMDEHGWLENWEVERFNSMEEKLRKGMVFVDVGAYDGWQDALIARFVGGAENMVLIEPEPTNWGNIKAVFEANGLSAPKQAYAGLIGPPNGFYNIFGSFEAHNGWPTGPDYSKLISHTTFRHLDENNHNTCSVPLDDLVTQCDALNVDVEGAALEVLQSAEDTLRRFHPLIWVSIHGTALFHHRPLAHFPPEADIPAYLEQFGYKGTVLANDHEQEWFFE